MRVFYFHYNKPASKIAGRVKWSVHHKGACHIVDEVKCMVPCVSKVRNRQPFAVMHGRCGIVDLVVRDGWVTAYICDAPPVCPKCNSSHRMIKRWVCHGTHAL